MTRRFDRLVENEKHHMQSLCALAHYDFNMAGDYSYEQALLVIRQLGLPMSSIEEMFRRMASHQMTLSGRRDDFFLDRARVEPSQYFIQLHVDGR